MFRKSHFTRHWNKKVNKPPFICIQSAVAWPVSCSFSEFCKLKEKKMTLMNRGNTILLAQGEKLHFININLKSSWTWPQRADYREDVGHLGEIQGPDQKHVNRADACWHRAQSKWRTVSVTTIPHRQQSCSVITLSRWRQPQWTITWSKKLQLHRSPWAGAMKYLVCHKNGYTVLKCIILICNENTQLDLYLCQNP